MLLLFETPVGYGLFKVLNEGKLDTVEDIWKDFKTPEDARKLVKLKVFHKFENTAESLGDCNAIVDSKLSKNLRKLLKVECKDETLALADSKLGRLISEKLGINCVHNNAVLELMRGVRSQLFELIEGLTQQNLAPMSLGLAHSLCRYTLKFSPDKVDTMIVQAIGLLDDLDKELNTYAMRVREWYGWHFPELAKIIQDNIQYARAVKLMQQRTNAPTIDFSEFLSEETESALKESVQISMGTEISDEDMSTIRMFCDQVISLAEYRTQLYDYLRSRMKAIAPNLTVMVGELVGARLIAHAGSLVNLAKQPSSTIQILGAEKALFRALKTKHNTPKYGIIYHASLVGQAPAKFKGKIARVLAAKTALSIRYDALGEIENPAMGIHNREKVESRLRQLEGKALGKVSGVNKGKGKIIEVYEKERKKETPGLVTAAKSYGTEADVTIGTSKKEKRKKAVVEEEAVVEDEQPAKKKKKRHAEEDAGTGSSAPSDAVASDEGKKKKRKQKQEDEAAAPAVAAEDNADDKKEKKRKKKKQQEEEAAAAAAAAEEEPEVEDKKQKKKKKKQSAEEPEAAAAEETAAVSQSKKKKRKA